MHVSRSGFEANFCLAKRIRSGVSQRDVSRELRTEEGVIEERGIIVGSSSGKSENNPPQFLRRENALQTSAGNDITGGAPQPGAGNSESPAARKTVRPVTLRAAIGPVIRMGELKDALAAIATPEEAAALAAPDVIPDPDMCMICLHEVPQSERKWNRDGRTKKQYKPWSEKKSLVNRRSVRGGKKCCTFKFCGEKRLNKMHDTCSALICNFCYAHLMRDGELKIEVSNAEMTDFIQLRDEENRRNRRNNSRADEEETPSSSTSPQEENQHTRSDQREKEIMELIYNGNINRFPSFVASRRRRNTNSGRRSTSSTHPRTTVPGRRGLIGCPNCRQAVYDERFFNNRSISDACCALFLSERGEERLNCCEYIMSAIALYGGRCVFFLVFVMAASVISLIVCLLGGRIRI